jgi:Flp pilus assembly protein TadG
MRSQQIRRKRSGQARSGTSEPGQAMVELALVAPILILLVVGVVQFGVIFQRQIGIENAVREAARRGATLATPDGATAATNASWTLGELQTLLANTQGHDPTQDRALKVCYFTPAAPDDFDASGNKQVMVNVAAGYAHPIFMPIISLIIDRIDGSADDALRADAASEFHVEQSGSNDLGATPVCDPP